MKQRKTSAKSALRFFKDKQGVRSTNNPFDFTTPTDQTTLDVTATSEKALNVVAQSDLGQKWQASIGVRIGTLQEVATGEIIVCYLHEVLDVRWVAPDQVAL